MGDDVLAITGANGFLARHLRARLKAQGRWSVRNLDRRQMTDSSITRRALDDVQTVVHLAGVNRGAEEEVESGNVLAAEQLVAALKPGERVRRLLYANSIHSGNDNSYGRGKQRASDILRHWAESADAKYVEVMFPNLFGEWARPDYNSFVATFSDRLAHGADPVIETDRPLDLLHAQDAAQLLIDQFASDDSTTVYPPGTATSVSEVRLRLIEVARIYSTGVLPDLSEAFTLQLFNTYRSFLYPTGFPITLSSHIDDRGVFVETARSLGGPSQCSFSRTKPGVTRGQHFHLRKLERFVVLRGDATIAIRPLFDERIWRFRVSGSEPVIVDMPTLAPHSIENAGRDELITMFWTSETFDPLDPDTFPEDV